MLKTVFFIGLPSLLSNSAFGLLALVMLHLIAAQQGKEMVAAFNLANALFVIYVSLLGGLTAGTIRHFARHLTQKPCEGLKTCLVAAGGMTSLVLLASFGVDVCYLWLASPGPKIETFFLIYSAVVKGSFPLIALNTTVSAFFMFRKYHWLLLRISVVTFSVNAMSVGCFYFLHLSPLSFIRGLAAIPLLTASVTSLGTMFYLIKKVLPQERGLISFIEWLKTPIDWQAGFEMVKTTVQSSAQLLLMIGGLAVWIGMATKLGAEAGSVMAVLINFFRLFSIPVRLFGCSVGSVVAYEAASGNQLLAHVMTRKGVEVLGYILWPLAIVCLVCPSLLLRLFLHDTSADYTVVVQLVGLTLAVEPIAGFLGENFRVQGDAKPGFISALYLWCVAIPFSWGIGFYLNYGLIGIWSGILSFRLATALVGMLALKKILLWRRL